MASFHLDLHRVYPRGRGEAGIPPVATKFVEGLSPRARGSRYPPFWRLSRTGSIPAGAGKPTMRLTWRLIPGVYPRGRGEALPKPKRQSGPSGLSPRARGSLPRAPKARRPDGSIPAGAGKPGLRRPGPRAVAVYPRGRGEAPSDFRNLRSRAGLSPRARGSPGGSAAGHRDSGSIPAGAGKPPGVMPPRPMIWVYPRGRGEAQVSVSRAICARGLSPRARGSLCQFLDRGTALFSCQ